MLLVNNSSTSQNLMNSNAATPPTTPAPYQRQVHDILGLPFDAVTLEQAVDHIRWAATTRTRCFFSTPNLNFLMTAQRDEVFKSSVVQSDLSLADGMPIVWLAKWLGVPIKERVAGSDVFEALRHEPNNGEKLKVFFFGGPPGVAQLAAEKINAERGGMVCVGYESPGFGTIEDMSSDQTLAKINNSGADFLVVSLGAVKGQAWITMNLPRLNVPVVSHLGAVVNFVAEQVRRAPRWMQKTGLEWAWRIKEEPGLWRRYFLDGIMLINIIFRKK